MESPLKGSAAPPGSPSPAPASPSPAPAAPARAVSVLHRILAYRRFWILALVIFGLDQLTKQWIDARLPLGSYGPGARIEIFPSFLYFVHVGNTGAAWSMFSGNSLGLAVLAFGTLAALFFWRRHLGLRQTTAQIPFGLLCGGIVGNLVDRLIHGHVIDFIDVHFGNYVYPTFNVADSAICIGVFWYILWSLKQPAYGEAAGS
ncbi:MAG: signal peptidase II [Opitutaceae bacterium]|nr:signal peptidase II [Opitutaceae bacterium]